MAFLSDAFQDARFASSSSGEYLFACCSTHSLLSDGVSLAESMPNQLLYIRKNPRGKFFAIPLKFH